MSTWSLIGDARKLTISIGGPSRDRLVIRGQGSIEFDHHTFLGGVEKERIDVASKREASWEISEGMDELLTHFKHAYAIGHVDYSDRITTRAEARSCGIVWIPDYAGAAVILVGLPPAQFNYAYRMFSSIMSTTELDLCYSIRGDFDFGHERIEDRLQVTAQHFVEGAPMFSKWVEIVFYGNSLRGITDR